MNAPVMLHYGGLGLCALALVWRFVLPEEVEAHAMWAGLTVGAACAVAANLFPMP